MDAIFKEQNISQERTTAPAAGLALEVAKRECGFVEHPDEKWKAMTRSEREDWLADEMITELKASCRT